MKILMKTSRVLSAVAIALVAMGAQAETYQGVEAPVSQLSRADVHAEAVSKAASPNQNVVLGSRGPAAFKPMASEASIRDQALRTASAPNQNVVAGSRVNSRVISNMQHPMDAQATAKAN